MLKLCVSKNPGQFDFSPLKMYKESIYKMLLTQLCKNHLATSSFCARCRPQHFFLIHVNQFCIALPCVPLEMLKRGFWNYISTYWPPLVAQQVISKNKTKQTISVANETPVSEAVLVAIEGSYVRWVCLDDTSFVHRNNSVTVLARQGAMCLCLCLCLSVCVWDRKSVV